MSTFAIICLLGFNCIGLLITLGASIFMHNLVRNIRQKGPHGLSLNALIAGEVLIIAIVVLCFVGLCINIINFWTLFTLGPAL